MDVLTLVLQATLFITLSAICSGLNLSLMSLDLSDLRRKSKAGDVRAKLVLPLRRNSHLSLAAILLGNVGMAAATSLILESKLGGIIAGITGTLLLVTFGEILPQALFIKNALTVTAFFAPFLRVLIIITYPISKPLQLILDKVFGKHSARLHTRHELGQIIDEHYGINSKTELDEDEVEIIKGALELSEKRVQLIMTPLKRVYWLESTSVVDAARIDEIKDQNYSRIPIFNKERTKAKGILLMKSLVDMDFDVRSYIIEELPLIPLPTVGSQTALDTMFRKFIGARTHLMAVEKNNKIIGVVTIEDLIEEIIGHEIEDESDSHR
ncbi:MAG: CNNM domain-containing protein [bacterium]|nr:CNNM domain-containing protein [bacterium]